MSPVRSFARKSSHFHVKRFAQALVLQTATHKWKQVCIRTERPIRTALISVSAA